MARCRADSSIQRVTVDGFAFPLGVYPIEAMAPRQGYSVDFEPADGDSGEGSAEWEEWPDRYVYDIVIGADRLEALTRGLLALLPGRVYPILDVLGQDAYREVDPYISYELVGMDRFTDALRRYRSFFFEDGLSGFGAMVTEPFLYVFIDEHKIITVRAETELREKVEKLLHAFDLEVVESPAGADAAAHEHRGVLEAPEDRPDLLTAEEVVEHLRDEWRLTLNVDAETNVDDEGTDLGITAWRCIVRVAADEQERCRYVEAFITAGSYRRAEELAMEAADTFRPPDQPEWYEAMLVSADRLTPEGLAEALKKAGAPAPESGSEGIISQGWLE